MKRPKVICVHIGARAHYLLPKALQKKGLLHSLITDTWIRFAWLRLLLNYIPINSFKSLSGRFTDAIPGNKIKDIGIQFLVEEIRIRNQYPAYGWPQVYARDLYFKNAAANRISTLKDATHVLGISYTANNAFKVGKQKGLKTILYQIDPGKREEDIVASLTATHAKTVDWQPAPASYWLQWQEECTLADRIFVNSNWSKQCLMEEGIDADKISIIPLPFELNQAHLTHSKIVPETFTKERPLRCLFLGTLTLRKGIHIVLEAAALLHQAPIEFILVGRTELELQHITATNVHYRGIVTRAETDQYYKDADVFLFPTLSDGFGLTQLEAMAWQVPVIATPFCGAVVEPDKNGWVMNEITVEELVRILNGIIENPNQLKRYSSNCLQRTAEFSTETFGQQLLELVNDSN